MIINRHNYEEFFLLYVDNELKQDERLEVENFVSQNPDLEVELKMLQEATLDNEDLKFENKEMLFKKEHGITLSNYEEQFVLCVDDELNTEEKEAVEKFVLKHPELQEEFILLQKTKLEPELLLHPDKASLYRKERRIVPILFKMSVAAAIMGIIAYSWVVTNTTSVTSPATVTVVNNAQRTEEKNIEKNLPKAVTQEPVASLDNKTGKENTRVERITSKENNSASLVVAKQKVEVTQLKETVNSQTAIVANNKEEKTITITDVPEKAIVNNRIKLPNENNTAFASIKEQEKEEVKVSNAVYREIDTEEDDNNTVYIGGAQINKTKLKRLFKKAAGFLNRKSRNNDEEKTVHIAAFELKTK